MRSALFRTPLDASATLLIGGLTVWLAVEILQWLVWNAVWRAGGYDECREIIAELRGDGATGACWAVLNGRLDTMLFGPLYPEERQWRAAIALASAPLLLVLAPFAAPRSLIVGCLAYAILANVLIRGGFGPDAPLSYEIGGYALFVLLVAEGTVAAIIFGVALALARVYGIWPWRLISEALIQLLRGVPLVALLFAGLVVFAFALPPTASIDRIHSAAFILALHAGALIAVALIERLRAAPPELTESAAALGFANAAGFRAIIAPHVLAEASPRMLNAIAALVRNTTLASMVGLMDPTASAKMVGTSSDWHGAKLELFIMLVLPFLAIGLAISFLRARWKRRLERRTGRSFIVMPIEE